MLPSAVKEVLNSEGAAAILTVGKQGPHLVGTWQSYIEVDGDTLIIPAGGYHVTEENVADGSQVILLVGREQNPPQGGHTGAGYRLEGVGSFVSAGPQYDRVKARFPWARAAFLVRVGFTQKLV